MAYKITIKISNGSMTITGRPTMPDGEFIIEGTDDGLLSLTQKDELGHVVRGIAHASHPRPGYMTATIQPEDSSEPE